MKATEKQMMIETYKNQFNHYLLSNGSDFEKLQLNGMKQMLKLFFSDKEIMNIENNVRITSEYKKSFFETVESWLTQFEKEQDITFIPFTWDMKGLNKIDNAYDFLYSEYKGFKAAMELAYKTMEKAA